ncbi:hypothetical protein C8Q76DRAFT_338464 [Earliella scabrosa]|nr:hypothetical protein C8Q76DRAFT_338464 [Earliella scabrosa]
MSDDFEKRCQEMLNQFNAAHPYQPYQPGTSPMGYQGSGFQSQSFNDPFPGFAGSFGFGGGYSGQPYATQSEMGPGFGNQPFPSQSTGFGHSSFPGHRPGSGFGFSSFNNAAPQPQGFPQPQTSHPPPPSGGSFGAPPPSMPDGSSEVHHHKKSKKFKIRIPFFSFNISERYVWSRILSLSDDMCS